MGIGYSRTGKNMRHTSDRPFIKVSHWIVTVCPGVKHLSDLSSHLKQFEHGGEKVVSECER